MVILHHGNRAVVNHRQVPRYRRAHADIVRCTQIHSQNRSINTQNDIYKHIHKKQSITYIFPSTIRPYYDTPTLCNNIGINIPFKSRPRPSEPKTAHDPRFKAGLRIKLERTRILSSRILLPVTYFLYPVVFHINSNYSSKSENCAKIFSTQLRDTKTHLKKIAYPKYMDFFTKKSPL